MLRQFSSSVVIALALCVSVSAQSEAPPAYIAVLDGDVSLVRQGQPLNAIVNMPVVSGDRIMTAAGRVEVMFPDGAALDLDENGTVDLDGARIRLSSGRARLVVPPGQPGAAARYEIDTPAGAVLSRGPGTYRADASGSSAWALSTRSNTSDGFDGWSDALRAARTAPPVSASAEHLPDELRPYDSTLDQNGTWQYAPTYGYVWYPRVESDWRPYYDGTWVAVPSYGWTWIGVERWEYPTHHYGRWGYANNRWFWIPGRAYSPAWVAWGYAGDYVSWCPLGIDSRPVFAMTVGYGNPWAGWTVVTRSHFGGRGYVPRFAVAPRQLPAQTPFVVQSTPPTAVPRTNTFSSVSSGSVAVPRGAPTQTSVPAAPQSVATPSGQATAAKPGVQRGERRAQDAQPNPAHPGDDPAYAPHYAPPPAQAPHQSRAEPKDAEKAAPPQRAAPPPQKAPPASKPAEREKPSENGKARGRGGR